MAFPVFSVFEYPGALNASYIDSSSWGSAGAPLKTQVSAMTLTISMPDPTTLLPDITNQNVVDLFARGAPITNPIPLLPTDFLQVDDTTKIPDGIYGFLLTVTYDIGAGDVVVTDTWHGYFVSLVTCCADNLANSLPCKCDECLTHKQINLLTMRLDLYSIALNQTYCQNNLNASIALLDAQDICERRGCKSCGCS